MTVIKIMLWIIIYNLFMIWFYDTLSKKDSSNKKPNKIPKKY